MPEHSEENLWPLFHTFNRYVRWGLLEPMVCPNDDHALYLRMDSRDNPALACPMCLTIFIPGVDVIDQIRQAITDVHKHPRSGGPTPAAGYNN